MWENASSYLGSGFSRGTGHLQQQFLSRDGVITGLGGTRPHPGETCRLVPGELRRVWSAGMMGFNEKRKQGRQASLSILGVKLQSPGRKRLERQEPYPSYYSARYSPSLPGPASTLQREPVSSPEPHVPRGRIPQAGRPSVWTT